MSESQFHLFRDYAARAQVESQTSPLVHVNRRTRVKIVSAVACLWAMVVIGRLYHLQIADAHSWEGSAKKQHGSSFTLAAERGAIRDRNGKLFATSVPSASIYIRPHQIRDKEVTAVKLANLIGIDKEDILQRMESESRFVWIKRQLPRPTAEALEKEELRGVGYLLESRRYYPYGSAASTLIGKVGIDGGGLSGLEARFNTHLNTSEANTEVVRDGFGKLMHVSHELKGIPKGSPLSLTLDASLQLIMDEELEEGRQKAQADRAFAVMMNATSGEILGMSQSPSPNFNQLALDSRELLKNHALELSFEPGSILKPFIAAMAIEEEETHFHELINCEKGSYRYGGHTINDVHPSSLLSTYNVVVHSSNIGMTKLGDRLGKERIYQGLRRFGFGSKTGLPFPGESSGLLRNPKQWYPIDIATHSFGQGVAVTPLQIVRAMSALANGGILPSVSLILDDVSPELPERVLTPDTANLAKRMLVGVVEEKEGTGSRARIPGVIVGGKTGTAQRPREDGRGYEDDAYVASFAGFADGSALGVSEPLVLLVVMDRPRASTIDGGRAIYGGVASAPVFKRIMQRSLHTLSTRNEYTRPYEGLNERWDDSSQGMIISRPPANGTPSQKQGFQRVGYYQ